MKSRNILIASFAALFLASSCSDVNEPDEIVKANPGDEVVFGAALPATKTVYGDETKTGFPIYWVNGDKVRVASPQCMSGRNTAIYEVAVDGTTQNYATSLTKTGDTGVQWGDAATADFYSIYPSSASTALTVDGNSVTTTLHVDATQFASTTDNGTSYYAQPAEMGNVVMYAKTAGVTSGSTVELHYTPFSTVLEFEINASNESVAGKQTEITIQSLTLTAPTGTTIAGNFNFNFDGPSITPDATGASTAITMHFLDNNQYTTVLSTTKTTLKAKMCLMPISGVESLAGWKVEVNTSAGTFIKTLDADDLTGKNTALAPGKVHKIKLPKLNYASQEWIYNTANWITSLPDYTNIYLSELSLPGAWYAGSTESYQATSDIPTLWNAGVRAFAVECRSYTPRSGILGLGNLTNSSPTRIALSGTGTDKNGAYTSPELGSCTYISSIISSVASSIKSDEYGVLVLSYADGGDGGHRALDYQYFINGIANEITQSGATNIYSGTIDKNTTVNDVLGKLIIKVNVDEKIPIGSYGSDQNYLMSYNPFLSQMDAVNYAHPYYSNLYWKTWSDDYKTASQLSTIQNIPAAEAENKFIWVFSSANRTQTDTNGASDLPTYSNRKTALGSMMSFSKTVYDKSYHNVWFYFNCGGTEATAASTGDVSPTAFATQMNAWLLEQLQIKIGDKVNSNGVLAPDPSPLGIVMFNQCTSDTYNGPAIIKAIIEMNSKFYLKHAGTTGGSTGGNATPTAENDGIMQQGGAAF
ncbi:MAG: hypothetical protein SPF15_04140 [Candidatus Cryptobacteroides sp.]|uniref:hypothetical protein n=1 Tax=Candidatus Cryptobacteroides sp. TaxID=2952915 RepID=UPI002A820B27|nr:hypothetical protein [Candidatus Cryptobacteroides sp.]MDY5043178.1 hypothetical protein [Candidatus Cryptobacteroides sp.]